MRLAVCLVTLVGVVAPAAVAMACPPRSVCVIATRPSHTGGSESARPARPSQLNVAPGLVAERMARTPLTVRRSTVRSLQLRDVADPTAVEMPWIWRALRHRFYSKMPNRETPDFSISLAPVAVTTPSNTTVPGLGIAGRF